MSSIRDTSKLSENDDDHQWQGYQGVTQLCITQHRRDPELQVESEILRCFKALLNNTVSI